MSRIPRISIVLHIALAALIAALCAGLPASAQGTQGTPTPTFSPDPITLTISGQVTLGSAGSTIPAGLQATLHLLRNQSVQGAQSAGQAPTQYDQRQSAVDAQGNYRFESVTARPGDLVFISAEYEGIQQSSVLVELPNEARDFSLPLTLYAGTQDPGGLTLLRARHILNVQSTNVIQVLASYFFRNNSDRFYLSADRAADGQPVSVNIPLPIGTQDIAFDRSVTGRATVGGTRAAPIVQDLRPVLPGQVHELVFSYLLPFAGGLSIDQDFPYHTEAVEILFPANAGMTFDKGQREFEATINTTINPQRPYEQYALKTPLNAGERLIYTLNVVPKKAETDPAGSTPDGGWVILASLISAGIALITLAVMIVRRIGRGSSDGSAGN